jgi:hypothetical protein
LEEGPFRHRGFSTRGDCPFQPSQPRTNHGMRVKWGQEWRRIITKVEQCRGQDSNPQGITPRGF